MPHVHSAKLKSEFSKRSDKGSSRRAGSGLLPLLRPMTSHTPMAHAVALLLAAGGVIGSGSAYAARPFSSSWYAANGAMQETARTTGMVNGKPVSSFANPAAQQQQANAQLQKSIDNLSLAAHGIAMQQAAQAAARAAALGNPSSAPNGLGIGGLDTGSLASSWINASAPTQTTTADGKTQVDIVQTADKAIANWETFNVGKNTIVQFDQASASWAILNRITDPMARPSQIQGQIRAPGTVLIVNQNGIVFSGSSQINTRNLVAAAAGIGDTQFRNNGIYSAGATTPSFTDAQGKLEVQAGAQIVTGEPASVTQGGGYVLLLGREVSNAGEITTRKGQALLAAGDSFIIRQGVGTAANQYSTVRGNEIMPQFAVGSDAGKVDNSGVIMAREGDITLAGHDVRQQGVAVSSTTVNIRGTVHLLNSASDDTGSVTLGAGSLTAVVIEDDGTTTALDSQRDALIKDSTALDPLRIAAANAAGASFDNYATLSDRRDLSRIEIVGGGNVNFEGDSVTLATGGQLAVSAGNSASGTRNGAAFYGAIHVDNGATLDVSGSVGVKLTMESNNIKVNVQGNELRDAPLNRDAGTLFNSNLWVDRSTLVFVPAGTDGYDSDRWYTAGGLLEVSGYLGNQGHSIGEWSAQGGTINLTGDNVVAQAGSRINLSGGTLDVATGTINITWLKGSDGRLYSADNAPADLLYRGVYTGFEADHPRWGFTEHFYNPLIAPRSRLENGYTVGRDAGALEIWSSSVTFDADIDASVYNGPQQTVARPGDIADAYKLGQKQAALAGQLLVQTYDPKIDINSASPRLNRIADVRIDDTAPAEGGGSGGVLGNLVWLNLDRLNEAGLGGLSVNTKGKLSTGGDLALAPGGVLDFQGSIALGGSLTARGGSIRLAAGVTPYGELVDLTLGNGATIDTRGLWTNEMLDPASAWGLAFINGGPVQITTSGAMALEKGSRIDTSAGGAILADGKTQGGNGGDVTLSAGGLVIDGGGVIAAYGFGKGGKLSIATPAAISIGGPLTQTSGQLAAGETAPFDLTVSQDFILPAGYTLPVELKVSSGSFILLGKEVPANANVSIPFNRPLVIGPNGWITPIDAVFARDPVTQDPAVYAAGSFIPAGYLVFGINNQFPAGYVMPADAFTAPVPIFPRVTTYAAGAVLAQPLTVTAGTLLNRGTALPVAASVLPVFEINDAHAFFHQGFSAYNLSGAAGLIVQPGTQVDVAMPLYSFTGAGAVPRQTLSGDALAQAVELVLPPLFTEDRLKGTLKQRAGADLSLTGGVPGAGTPGPLFNPLTDGALIVGEGAALSVDPARSISLTSKGQIDIEGSLTAPGGAISIVNTRTIPDVEQAHRIAFPNDFGFTSDDPSDTLSVWIGEHAVLDAAGRAYTAPDALGNSYGVVLDGGSVLLGGAGGNDSGAIGAVLSSASYVVVRPGARIDVSGAGASLSQNDGRGGRAPRQVASNGGAITVSSYVGFFLDGEMRAQAGGAGASGGSLSLVLEAPTYANVTDGSTRSGRVLYVAQDNASLLPADLAPGQLDAGFVPAQARISAGQIGQGGFDSLSLWGRTAIAFDGDVDLHLGRSLTLQKGFLYQTTAGANVNLSAPYVLFDGGSQLKGTSNGQFWPAPTRLPAFADGGTFSVDADLIDLRNAVRTSFDRTALHSSTDLRFLVSTAPPPDADLNASGTGTSELRASGDIELAAAQIYPASGVIAVVQAGGLAGVTGDQPSRLVIGSTSVGGDVPSQPYSVFGSLTLSAGIIEQGGVVRAPFGALALNASQQVDLLPGSITSIGTSGLIMPFGGTVDGVTYTYNGATAPAPDLLAGTYSGTFSAGGLTQFGAVGLTIHSPALRSDAGSLLDLSGGGNFVGGAFVTGRGGSVDTLLAPLNPGGKVYALVPGAITAPVPGGYYTAWSGAVPGIGQQITLPDGVPGLAGGAYTLMPANYALLPGAWRVELGGRTGDFAGALALRNGSYAVSGVQGIADTGIRDSLSTLVTLTPGPVLRTYSAYNEQSFSQFQLARARTFGSLRPLLEADGKRLEFDIPLTASANTPANSALVFNGGADFSAGQGGLPGSFTLAGASGAFTNQPVNASLVITGPGSVAVNDAGTLTVSGAEIGKVKAPNLYLGGVVRGFPNVGMNGADGDAFMLDNLIVESGVTLTGGQVVLGANQKVTLRENASINTLGQGQTGLDSSAGLLFGAAPSIFGSYAMLLVSNGQFTLDAPSGLFGSNIELQDGVSLYSEGTVGFYSDLGVSLIGTPKIGTRNLSLAVPSFNIGTDAALAAAQVAAGSLPAGMNLNQRILNALFAGKPDEGVPAIENLTLTAGKSINFFGSVDLDTLDPATGKSRLAQFTLNTPAIYGYGGAGDTVRLIADTLVWTDTLRSITYQDGYETRYGSTAPGAPIAGALGGGRFQIDANSIVIGNITPSRPDTSISYDRLMLGFSDVYFNAAEHVTGNAKGSLSVYQSGADPSIAFDPATYAGVGGNLHLNTPLLTGDPASVVNYYAGGKLSVSAPAGSAAVATTDQVGATLNLHAQSIDIASAIVLPSGLLTLTAEQDVTLADGALLDVSGRRLNFFDVTRDTWGGDISIESRQGNILQSSGAAVDVSAANQDAGTLKLAALEGSVQLGGSLRGSGAEGYSAGSFDLRAQRIGDSAAALSVDFAALNTKLGDAGFFGARAFDFRQGDLVIGNEVKAHSIAVSTDGGSLTVNGRIDASGVQPGSIRLAARDDLRLAGGAVLDTHGAELQVDSYGQPIEATNRGAIELTSAQGWLRLDGGATIDVSAPGAAYGRVALNARRGNEIGGDVLIDASGRVNVIGAKSIAVNAFWTYSPTDADGTIVQDNGGGTPVNNGEVGMDQIDAQSQIFYGNALGNGALQTRLAGLKAYGAAYHLRPGVEITSTGNLTVKGDIDLAGYRYGPDADRNPASPGYGAGEPLALSLRAAGDLNIKGSITDGFGRPKATPDDSPILLQAGQTLNADFTLPDNVTLAAGTKLGVGTVLPLDVTLQGGQVLHAGQAAAGQIILHPGPNIYGDLIYGFGGIDSGENLLYPVMVVAGQVVDDYWNGQTFNPGDVISYPLGEGTIIRPGTIFQALGGAPVSYADVVIAAGPKVAANKVLPQQVVLDAAYTLATAVNVTGIIVTPTHTYAPGSTIDAGTVLPQGTTVGAGAALPFDFDIQATTWLAGNPFVLVGGYTLSSDLNVAAGTVLAAGSAMTSNVYSANSRPVWAVAPMLAADSQSASIRLVGGADLAAADTRTLLSTAALHGKGNITLNDPRTDNSANLPIFSVIRTGTGDLELLAGGSLSQATPFGVYTAGTQSDLPSGNAVFNPPRASLSAFGTSITGIGDYDNALNDQATWFPDHGGDLLIAVQRDLSGNIWRGDNGYGNDEVAAWLWHQGADGMGQAPAWSINFGTFVSAGSRFNQSTNQVDSLVRVAGFNGYGALGGGNATLLVDGDAGLLAPFNPILNDKNSSGLMVAVGATGRVTSVSTTPDGAVTGGALVQTGGGNLTLKIGGGLNGVQASLTNGDAMQGTLADLRGDIDVAAGAIGSMALSYGVKAAQDPRGLDQYTAQSVGQYQSGPVLAPGDGAVSMRSRGDLVMGKYQDAPMLTPIGLAGMSSIYSFQGALLANGLAGVDYNWFSLWTPNTSISLLSAGGNLMPFIGSSNISYLPPKFAAVAASANIYYGSELSNQTGTMELLPSATGQLELLAAGSIYAVRNGGLALGLSGAQAGIDDLPNPFKPAWIMANPGTDPSRAFIDPDCLCGTNTLLHISPPQFPGGPLVYAPRTGYFAFQAGDTPGSLLHAGDAEPIRLYAVEGDIVGAVLGGVTAATPSAPAQYMVAKAAQVRAGRDVVGFGLLNAPGSFSNSGSYIMNANATDVSVIEAGRDIFYASVNIAGPGTLEVTAGRNLYQGDGGSLVSLGAIVPGDTRSGADIAVTVGAGAAGPDYAALKRYLDAANQADLTAGHPLAGQPGKVAKTYGDKLTLADWLHDAYGYTGDEANAPAFLAARQAELDADRASDPAAPHRILLNDFQQASQLHLVNWLASRYGSAAGVLHYEESMDPLAFFNALAPEQQRIFLRTVYYAELRAGGREYNDPNGPRFGSYLRGREAIATLFPNQGTDGQPFARGGDFTQFGPSGIQTRFGGDIQMLVPAGQIVVGTQGPLPPASSGLITQGEGDIALYSEGSILLGLSRIMSTFGGSILGWSAEGDINAGRGSKTTLVYTPPKREYDNVGDVTLSPQVPSTGAGIATLAPIPEVPAGDVDLIAPLGTIDAGEAGIRVSGNVNLAALQVVNAANIDVKGKSTGVPLIASVNVGALTNAGAAATQAAMAAQDVVSRERSAARQALPSIFTVRVLGFGTDGGNAAPAQPASDPQGAAMQGGQRNAGYDPGSAFQVLGQGKLDPAQLARLTEAERRRLPK